jgi:hypothetical protein
LYKGQVEYGADATYGSISQMESDFVKAHVVPLQLQSDTSYHYRIILTDNNNKEWKSNDYPPFKTPSPEQSASSE